MPADQILFSHVSFTYDGMNDTLFDRIDLSIGPGWTGVVGANGAGKTTFLQLATGLLAPDSGVVTVPSERLYANQRTDSPSDLELAFGLADDGDAWRLKGLLSVEYDWLDRWESLSHGERKRIQIGACLWRRPALLSVDEPTNHLDRDARNMVIEGFRGYHGVGLLVSHDRELLDTLTERTLILSESGMELRAGSFSSAWEERKRETQEMRDRYTNERRSLERLKREESRRRQLAAQQHARRSKKGIPIKDHDARFKKNRARISGKDGVGGKLLRQMDGRLSQAETRLDSFRTAKDRKLGIHVETSRSKSDALFVAEPCALPLGAHRQLFLPDLVIEPGSRIGITGPNGCGKSTLVRHVLGHMRAEVDRVICIPQEIRVEESAALHRKMLDLPKNELGLVLSVVSRLGTRPDQLIESQLPSPGETRKLMLALGIHSSPSLIIMDEPTNHMDIPSIECIEDALADTVCALLLVSHDRRFLGALCTQYWRIEPMPGSDSPSLRIEHSD
jgi:macrolide transport system ATP-binding/permease protein